MATAVAEHLRIPPIGLKAKANRLFYVMLVFPLTIAGIGSARSTTGPNLKRVTRKAEALKSLERSLRTLEPASVPLALRTSFLKLLYAEDAE